MPQVQRRRRKIAILTLQGLQKLQTTIAQSDSWNHYTKSVTLEVLNEKTGLSTHTLSKVHARQAYVDRRTLVRYFSAFNLTLEAGDYISPIQQDERGLEMPSQEVQNIESKSRKLTLHWGTAPDVSAFYGRTKELATLKHWVSDPHCRLVTLVGMGGIGKTWLATKLAEQMHQEFKVVIWRSLQPLSRSHPSLPFNHFLDDLIHHLAPHSNSTTSEPTAIKIRHLTDCLRCTRCLLVLDNVESVVRRRTLLSVSGKSSIDSDDVEDEAYSNLLKHLGLGRHQSCIVLTSRVEPQPFWLLSNHTLNIHALPIQGLSVTEIQQMFRARGTFQGTVADWDCLVNAYNGNPQILGIVARIIQRLFGGNITDFLKNNAFFFDDLCELLNQQLREISDVEQEVVNVLAIQNMPLSFSDLRQHISSTCSTTDLLESLKALSARSLIEYTSTHFSLSPMLVHYVRECLISMQRSSNGIHSQPLMDI